MKRIIGILALVVVAAFVVMCNRKSDKDQETILKGKALILVDETILPIAEDQEAVFESDYAADITLAPKSEGEAMRAFLSDSARIILLTRKLSPEENRVFENKKIKPRVAQFATDAIAMIANKSTNDTVIALTDVVSFMQGKPNGKIKGLVFDNPNSSTVRYMNKLAGLTETPQNGIYSFNTNEEVIKFVAENKNMIGIIGLNWLSQAPMSISHNVDRIKVLAVQGVSGGGYYTPSQNNLAEQKYPLARDLYIVNAQGFSGLGVGFASFIAGERGQRIVLKSGLLPIRIPGRKIVTRNNVEKEKLNTK